MPRRCPRRRAPKYARALEHHLSELADEQLRAIDLPRIVAHQHHLLETGRSPATVREVLIHLSGIMQVAAEHGLIPANPVRAVRKTGTEREDVRPLTALELEALIASLEGRSRIIVVLAGHLGLRPLELRSVPWRGLDDELLHVGRSQTKRTARRGRTIEVPRTTLGAAPVAACERAPGGGSADHRADQRRGAEDLGPAPPERRRTERDRARGRHAVHAASHARQPLPLRRPDRSPRRRAGSRTRRRCTSRPTHT